MTSRACSAMSAAFLREQQRSVAAVHRDRSQRQSAHRGVESAIGFTDPMTATRGIGDRRVRAPALPRCRRAADNSPQRYASVGLASSALINVGR
jgi:hypothetical protein